MLVVHSSRTREIEAAARIVLSNVGEGLQGGRTMSESLEQRIGPESAARLAIAYDRAVGILSLNDRYFVPSAPARLEMIRAMLADGPSHGFDTDRLTLSALSTPRR